MFLFLGVSNGNAYFLVPGPLHIGITGVTIREEATKSVPWQTVNHSEAMVNVLPKLLPDYLLRGFEKGLDRRVIFMVVQDLAFPSDPVKQPLAAILSPSVVVIGPLGITINVDVLWRREAGGVSFRFSEFVLISPTADYGDLDVKLSELGLRLAKRFTQHNAENVPPEKRNLPSGIVGLGCIFSLDTTDTRLRQLGRLLTIELPFFLTQASKSRNLDLVIRGLDLKESVTTCEANFSGSYGEASPAAPDDRIVNFSWGGTVSSVPFDPSAARLIMRASERTAWQNYRPLKTVRIEDSTSPDLRKIADDILTNFVTEWPTTNSTTATGR